MRKIRSTALMLSFIFCLTFFAQAQGGDLVYARINPSSPLPYCTGCIFTGNSTLDNILATYAVTEYRPAFLGASSSILQNTYIIKPAVSDVQGLLDALAASGLFDLVEISGTYENSSCPAPVNYNDYVIDHDHLDFTEAKCAWSITTGNPALQVAVVDEEMDDSHPDFAGKVTVQTANTIPFTNSHGMRAAGVVCAQTNNSIGTASIGYNLKVNFYSVRSNGGLMQCLWDAYLAGNKVINASYVGWAWTPTEVAMFQEMVQNGCTVVFGAGNRASDVYHHGIWDLPGILIVGGFANDLNHATTGYSHYAGIDLCALGWKVSTLDKDASGNHTVVGGWGTSFAAPQVTATIGLMLSANPCLNPVEIEAILKTTTHAINDASSYPGLLGTGGLNAYRAVQKAANWGNAELVVATGTTVNINLMEYYRKITVEPGGVLNVNNTTLLMAENGLITVKPGGRMNVTNSTIQAREPWPGCNFARYKWEGIALGGNPGLDQSPISNQGYLLLSGSVISDAKNAVLTYNLDGSGNIDWSKTGGGIIKGVSTTFRNNGRHIGFYKYRRPGNLNDISSFLECTFEADGSIDISGGVNKPNVMITAWAVRGVVFKGCDFKNINGSINAHKYAIDRGTGIYSLDAQLLITDKMNMSCTSVKKGSFFDLSKGVHAVSSPFSTITSNRINKQDFTRNDRGVIVENGVSAVIDHNYFDVTVPAAYYNRKNSVNDPSYATGIIGVYTNSASGFRVEENLFKLTSRTSGQAREIVAGCVMSNADANGGGGFFRLNEANTTNLGSQTQKNGSTLTIPCNAYKSTIEGIPMNLLSVSSPTPNFGICNSRNTALQTDYGNTVQSLTSFHLNHGPSATKTYVVKTGQPNRPSNGRRMLFANCSGTVLNYNCTPLNELTEPCSRPAVISPDDARTKFAAAKNELKVLSGKIADGKSETLRTFLEQGTTHAANVVYDELISHSPYLSDEILLTMLSHSTHLTEQELTDVLVANAALSQDVLDAVNAMGFSTAALDQISEAQDDNTPAHEVTEVEYTYYYTKMVNAKNNVLLACNTLILEAEENGPEEDYVAYIIEFLRKQNDLQSKMQLIATLYQAGLTAGAAEALEALPLDETEEMQDFVAYYQLMIGLELEERNIYQLSDVERSDLVTLSEHETTAGIAARGILTLTEGQVFDLFIERINEEEEESEGVSTGINKIHSSGIRLEVFPNPSAGRAVVRYQLTRFYADMHIVIRDITGKEVYSHPGSGIQGSVEVNTDTWTNGVYFIELHSGNERLGAQKLVVLH